MTRNVVICGEHIESAHFSGLEINLNPVFLGDLGPNLRNCPNQKHMMTGSLLPDSGSSQNHLMSERTDKT